MIRCIDAANFFRRLTDIKNVFIVAAGVQVRGRLQTRLAGFFVVANHVGRLTHGGVKVGVPCILFDVRPDAGAGRACAGDVLRYDVEITVGAQRGRKGAGGENNSITLASFVL